MTRLVLIPALLLTLTAGCSGNGGSAACDDGPYLAAARAPKVEAPDGLDELDPLNEMPLPAASPRQPRPADAPCIDQPPQIIRME